VLLVEGVVDNLVHSNSRDWVGVEQASDEVASLVADVGGNSKVAFRDLTKQ
jgi:hypothetical protein